MKHYKTGKSSVSLLLQHSEAETEGSPQAREQPGLHRKTLSQVDK